MSDLLHHHPHATDDGSAHPSTSPAEAASLATSLATSATDEWAALVGAAVLGTDRRPAPHPLPGWDTWARASDPAVALLDRAAAVVVARRAGACPQPPPHVVLPPAPPDTRPPCPAACAVRLARILSGEHDLLLPEWFERCESSGVQLPWMSLPALLLKGRRDPALDATVRRLAAGRASWLAEVVPELGVKVAGSSATASSPPFAVPPRPPDSGAVVTSILNVFYDRMATWATAPEMRLAAAAIDPVWLPSLVVELGRIGFDPAVERTRREVLVFAEFRHEMHREFATLHRVPLASDITADAASAGSPRPHLSDRTSSPGGPT